MTSPSSFQTNDRVADLGGGYWTIVLPGRVRSLVLRDGAVEVEVMDNADLVKLDPCPRCGVLVEPYAPCGSPECRTPDEWAP
jgi:hypothetical protein